MSVEGILQVIPGQTAAADYSTTGQYLFVKSSTTADNTVVLCASATDKPCGVLLNNPKSGAEAAVACFGVVKVTAGGTITAGDNVGTNSSGKAVTLVDGTDTTKYVVGTALQAAASGDIMSVLLRGGAHRAS